MPAPAAPLLLPEHLRLPDLAAIRTLTYSDLNEWMDHAAEALTWGPAGRNGCRRKNERIPGAARYPAWRDADGNHRSPDEWTPAIATPYTVEWYRHEQTTHGHTQPSFLGPDTVAWDPAHRADGPIRITVAAGPTWRWQGTDATRGLARLLTDAWNATDVTDEQVHALLDRARAITQPRGLVVTPEVWAAHVLAANPSPALTAATRAWLALLTA